jgi:hypothetical protein
MAFVSRSNFSEIDLTYSAAEFRVWVSMSTQAQLHSTSKRYGAFGLDCVAGNPTLPASLVESSQEGRM